MQHRRARQIVLVLSGLNVCIALGISAFEAIDGNYLVAALIWILAPAAARAIAADWRKLRQND